MAKKYARLNWNSTTTYVSAENLNVMDKGIDDCDNAIELLNEGLKTVDNNLGLKLDANNFNNLFVQNASYDFKIINAMNFDNVVDDNFASSTAECVCYLGLGWGSGNEFVIGYEYKTKLYGYQLKLNFNGTMQYRHKNNSVTWSAWIIK